jgi:hypothetical protein
MDQPPVANRQAGRRCTICEHSEVGEIDLALGRDRSPKGEVAVRFGLSESAVQRHRSLHLGLTPKTNGRSGPRPPKALKARGRFTHGDDGRCPTCEQLTGENVGALAPEQIVKRAERILHVSESIALKAQDENDSRLALLAVDRCQRSIDTLARIAGLLKPDVLVDNRSVTNLYATWTTDALEALEGFHSALAAGATVAEAVEALQSKTIRALSSSNAT